MKLVLYSDERGQAVPGVLTERGVVSVANVVGSSESPQGTMQRLIDRFAELRPRLEQAASQGQPIPIQNQIPRLLAPLPWPGKILCTTAQTAGQPLLMTLKSPESVIGPGETVRLPAVGEEWQFVPEAELGLVIKGPAKQVTPENWRSAVFGYTCVVDVMARGDTQFGRDFWLAKADTLGPLGPCIVTAEEVGDPSALKVRSWVNGEARQDYTIGELEYGVPRLIEFATTVMTLNTGDVLACGTAAAGLEPIGDGDRLAVEIDGVGRIELGIAALARSRA